MNELTMYEHGFYFIKDGKLYCSSIKIPEHIKVDYTTLKEERQAFSDILGNEKYGFSFKIKEII